MGEVSTTDPTIVLYFGLVAAADDKVFRYACIAIITVVICANCSINT